MYIYIKVVTNTDGTLTKDLRTFATFDEALSTYHTQLGASINKCKDCLYAVLDENGNTKKVEKWVAPAAE